MKANTIQVVNEILAIVWDDGHESYFDFEMLRRACPCAMCKGEANVMVESKPAPQKYGPDSFKIRGLNFVGGYALQPHWADGHGSGIYSFEYLRKLCNCGQCAGKTKAC
jgi:DUF971 family protein